VQEFKVNTSPYGAEFGRTGGGVVALPSSPGPTAPTERCTSFFVTASSTPTDSMPIAPIRGNPASNGTSSASPWADPSGSQKRTTVATRLSFSSAMKGYANGAFRHSPARFLPISSVAAISRNRSIRPASGPGRPCRRHSLHPDRLPWQYDSIRPVEPHRGGNYEVLSIAQPGRQWAQQYKQFFIAPTNSLDADRVDLLIDHQLSSKHLLFGHYNWFRNLNSQPLVLTLLVRDFARVA